MIRRFESTKEAIQAYCIWNFLTLLWCLWFGGLFYLGSNYLIAVSFAIRTVGYSLLFSLPGFLLSELRYKRSEPVTNYLVIAGFTGFVAVGIAGILGVLVRIVDGIQRRPVSLLMPPELSAWYIAVVCVSIGTISMVLTLLTAKDKRQILSS